MAIITKAYFENGPLKIANADATDPDKQLLGNGETITNFIARYEREILILCLSYPLFKLFYSQFDISAEGVFTLKVAAADKWGELLNGKEYTQNGKAVIWRGLIFKDDITPSIPYNQSLIAEYIYSKYIYFNEITHENSGFQSAEVKNAVRLSGRANWAAAVNRVYSLAYYNDNSGEVSLLEFINDMNAETPETYPDFEMETNKFNLVNRWGL